ncbi:unnamed protein product [marine sediment metagenome]|uniref:Uncharacterized protein n=1 Tax=marine sediment metagenome TaxID=412755 RepID=X0ZQ95_9ZZZZ
MIRKITSIPANSVVDNLLTGSIYEFMPWNAAVNLGVLAAAGAGPGDLQVTVNSGSDTVMEEAPVNNLARFPVIPDDMDVQDIAAGGERLVVKVRNTTAGALECFWLVQLTPI